MMIVPGNHDVLFFGNISLGYLSKVAFDVEIMDSGCECSTWERMRKYASRLGRIFTDRHRTRERRICVNFEEIPVVFFGFDSNPNSKYFSAAQGLVSHKQMKDCSETLAGNNLQPMLKIALLHHHPVSVPYAPFGDRARFEETFMILQNAGTFLCELAHARVDLILHGHKHHSGFTSLQYALTSPEVTDHRVGVLAAGSATKQQQKPGELNQFNVVRLCADGRVLIERHFLNQQHVGATRNHDRFYFIGLDELRQRYALKLNEQKNLAAKTIVRRVEITRNGYSTYTDRFCDVMVMGAEESRGYPVDIDGATRPHHVRSARKVADQETAPCSLYRDKDRTNLRGFRGFLAFDPPRRREEGIFNFGYQYELFAGHTTGFEEFSRRNRGTKSDWEYVSGSCDIAAEELIVEVVFPDREAYRMIEEPNMVARAALFDGKDSDPKLEVHSEETARIRRFGSLERRDVDLTIRMKIIRPIPNWVYRVRWRYRQHAQSSETTCRPDAEACCEGLLRMTNEGPDFAFVADALKCVGTDIGNRYNEGDRREKLDVSLAVWDGQDRRLRVAASTFMLPQESRKINFFSGEGATGVTFEKQEILLHKDSQRNDEKNPYLRAEEGGDSMGPLVDYRVLLTIPWFVRQGYCVGVVSVGSNSGASRLLQFEDIVRRGAAELSKECCTLNALVTALGERLIRMGLNGGFDWHVD
jgi:hypothetical protein